MGRNTYLGLTYKLRDGRKVYSYDKFGPGPEFVEPSPTPTPSVTPSITPTSSITPTPSITPTTSITPSVTPSSNVSPTPTPSITPTITPTTSITPSVTITPTPSNTPPEQFFLLAENSDELLTESSINIEIEAAPDPTPTPTPSITPSPTPSVGYADVSFSVDTTLAAGTGSNQFKWDFNAQIMPMTVFWGDGDSQNLVAGQTITHTYPSGGIYKVTIRTSNPGEISWQQTVTNADQEKVISIDDWGQNYITESFPNLSVNSYGSFANLATLDPNSAPIFIPGVNNNQIMFEDMISFVSGVAHWDVSLMYNMQGTFENCVSFNEPLSGWNTSSLRVASAMFYNASSFDQDLSMWDISSLEQAVNMFFGTSLSTANYDKILVGWAAQAPNIQSNVNFSGNPCRYTDAVSGAARDLLVNTYGWTITDLGPI